MSFAVSENGQTIMAVGGPGEVPEGFTYAGLTRPNTASTVTSAMVDIERDMRIDAGFVFNGIAYQSRATDRENMSGSAQLAFMAIVAGAQAGDLRWSDPDADFGWIAQDNTITPMDAPTVVAFGRAAAVRKQALIFSARDLKNMNPIPSDYADDKWWP